MGGTYSFAYNKKDFLLACRSKDWQGLGKLMNLDQKLLEELGVSIKKLDEAIGSLIKDFKVEMEDWLDFCKIIVLKKRNYLQQ